MSQKREEPRPCGRQELEVSELNPRDPIDATVSTFRFSTPSRHN